MIATMHCGDTQRQHRHVSFSGGKISSDNTQHQGQADPDRESHRHPGDVDRSDQQDIGEIKNHSAAEGAAQPSRLRLPQVGQKSAAACATCCPW